jgi:hypothetical protein
MEIIMAAGLILIVLANVAGPAQAAQWASTEATTASLRTGGARLVSSDSHSLNDDKTALITYWEIGRGTDDLEIYRCVDVVGDDFAPLSQTCWKVRRAAGRASIKSDRRESSS